ncbi:MAG: hypothetical protein IPI14_06650, partial [Polaromonas sp.]|nr:hypothetical protein [Polaromonas sp.]
MNAVLQSKHPPLPESSIAFQSLNDAWLDRVLAIEQRAYSHPWSRANFCRFFGDGLPNASVVCEQNEGQGTGQN